MDSGMTDIPYYEIPDIMMTVFARLRESLSMHGLNWLVAEILIARLNNVMWIITIYAWIQCSLLAHYDATTYYSMCIFNTSHAHNE